ncbi:PD-(D/E)XK nuclease family protein [Chloroflexota bacterium]
MENTSNSEDIQALEKFLLDNPELDKLEAMLEQFNIFETLNMVEVEVRHSYILKWLLNPLENHGIGNYFLKQFLKYYFVDNRSSLQDRMTLFDLERLNLTDAEIRREWMNIDVLVVINEEKEKGKIVVAIENKVRSTEHSNQLQRYRGIIEQEFPDHLKFYIYLTPDSKLPIGDDSWNPMGYATIAYMVDNILEYKKDAIGENVLGFITQYRDILRRYIVGNSEIEKICGEIYRKHSKALDLIFKQRPDIELQISEYIQDKIKETPSITLDSAGKTLIRFTTDILDKRIDRVGEGWSRTKRIFLYEFSNYNNDLSLRLIIGPGPQEYREQLFNVCRKAPNIFNLVERKRGIKWNTVYQKKFLERKDFADISLEESSEHIDIVAKISKKWDEFVNNDLVRMDEHFTNNWK